MSSAAWNVKDPTAAYQPAGACWINGRPDTEARAISTRKARSECEVGPRDDRVGKPDVKHGKLRIDRGPILCPPFSRVAA
jgi:hypothetical protein